METNSKREYWINLARNNPAEFKRRSRMSYWKHLQQNDPVEYRLRMQENKLRQKHKEISRDEAKKIVATQERLFNEKQLSLF